MSLDTFEQALLTELRQHVAARGSDVRRSRARRRWQWAAGAVTTVVAAVVAALVLQPGAAYAVTDAPNGVVVVTIKRLDDAAGLEKALRAHGIDADVDYDADAAPPPDPSGATTSRGTGRDEGPSLTRHGAGPGTGPRIGSTLSDDGLTLRIDPDTIPAGAVLHITTSGTADGPRGLRVEFTSAP